MPVKILDLYSGMGGLSLGFALALEGIEITGLDNDGYAVDTYNMNLERFNARSTRQNILDWEPGEKYDIIIGGAPCQPYSVANVRNGGTKHPLYLTLPRFFDIVIEIKPKVFLMENVKGLITKRHRVILKEQLKRVEPYYTIKYQVLNASYYGVPQRRERLFVIGFDKTLGIMPSFPKPTHAEEEKTTLTGRLHKWVTVREAIGDLLAIPSQGLFLTPKRSLTDKVLRNSWRPIFTTEEPSFTVTGNGIKVVSGHTATGRLIYNENQLKRVLKFRKGKLDSLDEPSRVVKIDGRGGDKTNDAILVPITKHVPIIEEGRYRRLTVREVLRLQSFPDWWIFPSNVSTSRKYKLVGNAVPPALAYRLALEIGKLLGIKTRVPPREGEWKLPYFHRMFADFLDTG